MRIFHSDTIYKTSPQLKRFARTGNRPCVRRGSRHAHIFNDCAPKLKIKAVSSSILISYVIQRINVKPLYKTKQFDSLHAVNNFGKSLDIFVEENLSTEIKLTVIRIHS